MKRIQSFVLFGMLVLLVFVVSGNAKVEGTEKQKQEVMEVLKKFQAGYTARDVSKVDEYVNDLFDSEDIFVIGTSAYKPGNFEWCEDIKAVKKVIESDWKNWGNLKLKIENARIRIEGNIAWVAILGVSEERNVKKNSYDRAIKSIARTIELNKDDKSEGISREIMFWILQYTSRQLSEYEQGGDEFIYPLRITAVLVKKKGKWMFRQMNFAFPVTVIPDVRIPKEDNNK
jgi:hypothetical protein